LATDAPEININTKMDKMVTEITSGDTAFKNSVLKVIQQDKEPKTIEADFKDLNGKRQKDI
jgi:hypothetical protein